MNKIIQGDCLEVMKTLEGEKLSKNTWDKLAKVNKIVIDNYNK